ncbi:MAG: aminotransferase class I/II-fold pyridoxal phosphate-dependent enzyme [Candidatus Heimdallarchaeota archaeon]|nr:aminotransferase class I/II-fold pyridoxal phosphate-dependent enzyme [Candidatus Heimdallarchaeota archaeon]
MKLIDLRSDTVTLPTPEMREAAAVAELGDDVYGDDPSVNELESFTANLLGKEDALLVTSGTQGNLVSILAQTSIGDNVILEKESHIYYYETGGISAVGGTIPHTIESNKGYISSKNLEIWFNRFDRSKDVHFPKPSLLCLENTHNRHGGVALSPQQIGEMAETARKYDINTHLDGARLFNAVIYHNVDVKEFTKHVDSVQICLSKGLSAPIGSLVAGSSDFIALARRKRKMLGGGMRQAGIIAAPGLIALKDMRDRLVIDHINARSLAEGLREFDVAVWDTQTNIVICDTRTIEQVDDAYHVTSMLKEKGIAAGTVDETLIRFITHRHIHEEDIDNALEIIDKAWFG